MLPRLRAHIRRKLVQMGMMALLATLAGAAGAPAASAAAPSAAPATAVAMAGQRVVAAGTGVLDGSVLDGSTGGTPIASQPVSLTLTSDAITHTVASTTTDAHGHFQFAGLATDPSDIFVATTQVQGVVYSTDPVTLADNAQGTITLLAYDATNADAKIGFALVTYQLSQTETDVLAGTIHVTELVNVVNGDMRTFVGTPGPAANGQPMNMLRFGLPDGAADLSTHDGFSQGQIFQVDRGIGTTAPVPPGQTRFTFTYDVPYSGTGFVLSYGAIYPTAQVLVVVPAGVSANAPDFTSLGTLKSGGESVAVWQATNVVPGKAVSLELARLPVPGQHDQFNLTLLDLLAGLLALVAFGAVVYAWRVRGARPAAVMGVASAGEGAGQGEIGVEEAAAPEALLKALAQLDRAHDAGKVAGEPYRVQRAALKARLKARMLAEPEAAHGTAEGGPAKGAQPEGPHPHATKEEAARGVGTDAATKAKPGGGQ